MELLVHTDGGSRGCPGPAGIGIVILSPIHRAEMFEFIGKETNNYAEYAALIRAMQYAQKFGATSLRVFSDSQLMVRQVNGDYSVKAPELQKLHTRVFEIFGSSTYTFEIAHLRREGNTAADALANRAMDRARDRDVPWVFHGKYLCHKCWQSPLVEASGQKVDNQMVEMFMNLVCTKCKEFPLYAK